MSAECPRCRSRPRQRLLWLYLQAELDLAALRVVHLAPERALQGSLREQAREYVSVDLASPLAEVKGDITVLPFEDGSFDLALCSHVLEHIPDDRAAMSELRRVLASGGLLIAQHPVDYAKADTFEDPSVTDPAERLRLFFQDDHVRVYGRDLLTRLERAGFGVQVDEYGATLPEADVARFGLGPLRWGSLRNDLYICRVGA